MTDYDLKQEKQEMVADMKQENYLRKDFDVDNKTEPLDDTFGKWQDIVIRIPISFYKQLLTIANDSYLNVSDMLLQELDKTELFKATRDKR